MPDGVTYSFVVGHGTLDGGEGEVVNGVAHTGVELLRGEVAQFPRPDVVDGCLAGGEEGLGIRVTGGGEALLEAAGLAQAVQPLGCRLAGRIGKLCLAVLEILDVLGARHPERIVRHVALQRPLVLPVEGDGSDALGAQRLAHRREVIEALGCFDAGVLEHALSCTRRIPAGTRTEPCTGNRRRSAGSSGRQA